MCGIAGMIDPRLGPEEGETLLKGMLGSIRHRGPDYSSVWVDMPVLLGHNRLSIIDLSERANQPMEYDDLVIVYNGEVYNYIEIKKELEKKGYQFCTESDTEVILVAYKEWGGDCVNRFVGMWAFAIWDRAKKELFCSRDRFGIKPFYYIHSGDRFYFGSEYKPLKLSPIFKAELNLRQVTRGLRLFVACYRDETYFECLKALPERSNLVFRDGKVSVFPYWDIDSSRKFSGSFEEKKERFLELFRDSVRLHMRSDVAVAGMLSGGMDTSSIASVIGTDFPYVPYKTFTIYYEGQNLMDERRWVREVASAYPTVEPIFYKPSDEEIAESFDDVVKAHDAPLTCTPPISCYFVMKAAAASKIKVILDGQGSDEYLGGYVMAFERLVGGYLRHLRALSALKVLNDFRKKGCMGLKTSRFLVLSLLSAMLSEQLLWLGRYRYYCPLTLAEKEPPFTLETVPASRLKQYFYHLLFSTFLPTLLHYGDRMSMAFSVECRVPFLDHRLVELVFSLDDEDILREGEGKYILRKSLANILPPAILSRRDKQPFYGGEGAKWLKGPLRHMTEGLTYLDGLGVVSGREVWRLMQDFKDGDQSNAWLVWRIAALNYWLKYQ